LKNISAQAEHVLVSVPPGETGDPVLAACGEALAAGRNLRSVVYLSTIGVYGDNGGGWVDEETPPAPVSDRSRWRLAAEQAWQRFGARHGAAIAVLRLAGIYGPGQNALVQVARGKARRVVKPGQVFNRIHVSDIAQAIDAAFARRGDGVFNLADDEPGPAADPILFAAELLGREPPPEIPFEQAAASMSPMGLSFWQECRRVRNAKLKRELGVTLRYPTYREGLKALFAEINSPAPA
jgi:nucleoside-diphosphate-sugar epimerase